MTTGENGAFPAWVRARSSSTTRRRRPRSRANSSAAAERGFAFLDAPVSGGQAGAQNGALTVMGGGDVAAFDARQTRHCCLCPRRRPASDRRAPASSPRWSTRLPSPACCRGSAEAIDFAQERRLDLARDGRRSRRVRRSPGSSKSWKTMSEGTLRFRLRGRLDAQGLGPSASPRPTATRSSLPVTALVDQFYAELQRWAAAAGIPQASSRASTRTAGRRPERISTRR